MLLLLLCPHRPSSSLEDSSPALNAHSAEGAGGDVCTVTDQLCCEVQSCWVVVGGGGGGGVVSRRIPSDIYTNQKGVAVQMLCLEMMLSRATSSWCLSTIPCPHPLPYSCPILRV